MTVTTGLVVGDSGDTKARYRQGLKGLQISKMASERRCRKAAQPSTAVPSSTNEKGSGLTAVVAEGVVEATSVLLVWAIGLAAQPCSPCRVERQTASRQRGFSTVFRRRALM